MKKPQAAQGTQYPTQYSLVTSVSFDQASEDQSERNILDEVRLGSYCSQKVIRSAEILFGRGYRILANCRMRAETLVYDPTLEEDVVCGERECKSCRDWQPVGKSDYLRSLAFLVSSICAAFGIRTWRDVWLKRHPEVRDWGFGFEDCAENVGQRLGRSRSGEVYRDRR